MVVPPPGSLLAGRTGGVQEVVPHDCGTACSTVHYPLLAWVLLLTGTDVTRTCF